MCTLLSLLALLTLPSLLLSLLAARLRKFLNLLPQFFRFAPQLFFLPALLKRLLLSVLRGQFLLPRANISSFETRHRWLFAVSAPLARCD